MEIAVVGSGISGLSAAWLLSQRHRVTLYESASRPGGHGNTVDVGSVPVDTGNREYIKKLLVGLYHTRSGCSARPVRRQANCVFMLPGVTRAGWSCQGQGPRVSLFAGSVSA
jgi:monoamine oxidase